MVQNVVSMRMPVRPYGKNVAVYHMRAAIWHPAAMMTRKYDPINRAAYNVKAMLARYAIVKPMRSRTHSCRINVRGPLYDANAAIMQTLPIVKLRANLDGMRMATGKNTKIAMDSNTMPANSSTTNA